MLVPLNQSLETMTSNVPPPRYLPDPRSCRLADESMQLLSCRGVGAWKRRIGRVTVHTEYDTVGIAGQPSNFRRRPVDGNSAVPTFKIMSRKSCTHQSSPSRQTEKPPSGCARRVGGLQPVGWNVPISPVRVTTEHLSPYLLF